MVFARRIRLRRERRLQRRPGREANSHSVSLDSYYFLQGLKRYAVFGYTFRVDNARANRYDYDSHTLKLRYVHRETLKGLPLELELEGKFEDRQYKAPDPMIRHRKGGHAVAFFCRAEVGVYRLCVGGDTPEKFRLRFQPPDR